MPRRYEPGREEAINEGILDHDDQVIDSQSANLADLSRDTDLDKHEIRRALDVKWYKYIYGSTQTRAEAMEDFVATLNVADTCGRKLSSEELIEFNRILSDWKVDLLR